jgi:putative flippase GtrA
MFKKDYWYAAIIGLITAFFARIIIINNGASLSYGNNTLPLWTLFIILPVAEYVAYVVASKLFSHILALKQLGRFGIVGLMNFSVDTGIVTTLSVWTGVFSGAGIILINIVSTTIAIINSYFWQRTWTFGEKVPPTKKEFLGFVMVTLVGLAVNSGLVFALTTFIQPFNGLTPVRLLTAAKIMATLVSLFWNFLGYKFFVFK